MYCCPPDARLREGTNVIDSTPAALTENVVNLFASLPEDERQRLVDAVVLAVPSVADLDHLHAALAYAKAGWWVLPVAPGTKNPGSIVGGQWHERSTRDTAQVRRWWSDHPTAGIALHVGRSGAVVFDFDGVDLSEMPPDLAAGLRQGVRQATRSGGDRGHYVFAAGGETFGNAAGAFRQYGDVRGGNAVIIVEPSGHAEAGRGGVYRWVGGGELPPLPDVLRACLRASSVEPSVEPMADDAALAAWLDQHTHADAPSRLNGPVSQFEQQVRDGASRHEAITSALCWAFREAAAGLYSAREARDRLGEAFEASFNPADDPDEALRERRGAPGPGEFSRVARYAAAEAGGADPAATLARSNRGGGDTTTEADVERELHRLRVRDRAAVLYAQEKAAGRVPSLRRETLAVALGRPRVVVPHRIEGLHKVGYNSTVTAKYKTGKTTLGVNLLRSLADGEPFLGRFEVLPPDGRVGLLNYELDDGDMLDWLAAAGIRKTDRVAVLNLRGQRFTFAGDYHCAEFVAWCREMDVEVLDLDPHRLALAGFGSENDNDDVTRFTQRLDQIKADAGVSDLFLKVHTGRAESEDGLEHARGATSLDDWADQRWVLTKNGQGDRFMYAEGRLAPVREFRVAHDAATGLLTAEDGSRRSAKADGDNAAALLVQQIVDATPDLTTQEVMSQLGDRWGISNRTRANAAVKLADDRGLIHRVTVGRMKRCRPGPDPNPAVKASVR